MSNSNKHDEFFYEEFSNPQNAVDLLKNALPVELSQRLDYTSVNIENSRYVDDFFKNSYSDLLISATINDKRCFVYFLVEHKSYPDKFTLFQLMTYIVKIWNSELKENEYKEDTKLTPIIPIIFSHAKNGWKYQNDVSIYFEDKVLNDDMLRQFIPKFQALLYDLAGINDKNIIGNIKFRLTILAMKYIFEEYSEIIDHIAEEINKFEEVSPGIREYFTRLFRYIIGTSEEISPKDIMTKINNKKLKEVIVTVEQKLIEKGRKEGIKEGEERGIKKGEKRGRKETAKKMKEKGMDIQTIEEITGLSREEIEKL